MNDEKKGKHSSMKQTTTCLDKEDKRKILELIMKKFSQTQYEVTSCPQILLSGQSGVGKSSLVNAVFGRESEKVGCGRSTTMDNNTVTGKVVETQRAIIIHDCKGLETGVGETEKFVENHVEFLSKRSIHIVWYVVGCGTSRFLDSDLNLIHTLYRKYPVIVVLNKVDQIGLSKIDQLIQIIRDMISQYTKENGIAETNVKSIVKTSANIYDKDRRTIYMYKKCVKCGGERTLMDTFERVGICRNKECGHIQDISIDDGLKHLVKESLVLLPQIVRKRFICEQQVDLHCKDQYARELLTNTFISIRKDFHSAFSEESIQLIVELGQIFGMYTSSKRSGKELFAYFEEELFGNSNTSKFLFNVINYFEKILFKMTSAQLLIVCEGMFWYSFFRKEYSSHFNLESVENIEVDPSDQSYERYFGMLEKYGFEGAMNHYFSELQNLELQ